MPIENRSSNNEMISVPRDEVERLVKLLAYQAHPYPSPHAEYWQDLLDQPAVQRQGAPVEQDDPCKWTDQQVLVFLGVALRNVDLKGEVRLSEIRQGFEYMRDRATLERKP